MGRRSSTDEGSTLTPLMFQILMALSEGDRHGYGILQEIEERTGGAFRIGAGTLYRAIKQLVGAELMAEKIFRRCDAVLRRGGGGEQRGATDERHDEEGDSDG